MRFVVKHSLKDIKSKKCHYCLAFCSIFLAVITTLVINTILSTGPLIFLQQSQEDLGQYDATFSVISIYDWNDFWHAWNGEWVYMNYTHIEALYGKKYNIAPRLYRGRTGFHEAPGSEISFIGEGTFILIDTKREKEIGVGGDYPFGPLGPGECVISEVWKGWNGIE